MPYPCTRTMVQDVITLKPENTVEEALAVFTEHCIRNVPVVDGNNKFVGLFGLQQILMGLLPKAASMEQGVEELAFIEGAAPGIAKRLKKLHSVAVSELMNKEPRHVDCDTPTIQALNVMARFGSPVVVVDHKTLDFKGVITRQSLLDNLYGLLEEIEAEAE